VSSADICNLAERVAIYEKPQTDSHKLRENYSFVAHQTKIIWRVIAIVTTLGEIKLTT